MRIDDIEVCSPIAELILFLINNNFTVIEQRVADYHFHEVIVRMKGNNSVNVNDINIDKINQPTPGVFCCDCHWSCVKIEQ